MIGYACNETPQKMPMPAVLANRITAELSACRKSRYIQGILPDGKAQVTVEYEDGKPVRLDCVVVSCQHEEEKDLRILEKEIREKVLLPALRLLPPDENTRILINPSGRFVQGGLDADTGLTGRKLMVDAYGSQVPHGGGAFPERTAPKQTVLEPIWQDTLPKISWRQGWPNGARYPWGMPSGWPTR